MVEAMAKGKDMKSGDPKGSLLAARAAQEIGADFVKTYYTGDPDSFHKVVEGCPVPIVILGGEKAETLEQVFSVVHASIQAGRQGHRDRPQHLGAREDPPGGGGDGGHRPRGLDGQAGPGPRGLGGRPASMPGLAFASNFLWVMVIGLLGPSLPAIVEDLGISYAQAGLFFTLLSLGSLFGASLGASASDRAAAQGAVRRVRRCASRSGSPWWGSCRATSRRPCSCSCSAWREARSARSARASCWARRPSAGSGTSRGSRPSGPWAASWRPILVSVNFTAGLAWRFPFLETAAHRPRAVRR